MGDHGNTQKAKPVGWLCDKCLKSCGECISRREMRGEERAQISRLRQKVEKEVGIESINGRGGE